MIRLKIYRPRRRTPEAPEVRETREPEEKRRAGRSDHIAKFTYKLLAPMEGQGFTQNLSRTGYGLFVDNEIPPGAVMELEFEDPSVGMQPEKPIAKVIWGKEHQVGVKILGK